MPHRPAPTASVSPLPARTFSLALALLAACAPASGDDRPQPDGDDSAVPTCETAVGDQLARLRVPGLSVGLLRNGQLACTAVAGDANIEEGRAVTPATLFAWASVSKSITAVAAMVLVDDGELDLDADIDTYLPFSTRNPGCPDTAITVRQLLTHTSSIFDSDVYDDSYVLGDSPIALGDFVRGYVVEDGAYYDADNFDAGCPGTVNEYSNVGAGLLGHVIETVAGIPFDQFCDERIFTPLGMTRSSFHLANLDESTVAMPYDFAAPSTFTAHGHIGFPTFPDGLLRTSVPQMARLLGMMAGGGALGGTRVLAEATVEEMRRRQIPALDDSQGLIWFYDDLGGKPDMFGHDGDDPGTSSQIFYDPASGDGVIVVANGSWWDADDEQPEATALFSLLMTEATKD
jgi:CubicO group peptidase (beta-lactamase class C family)